jgi:predicted nucleic acid-binding protein
MSKISVVLDACVLFPMYLRDILLNIAEEGLYLPYWSQEILNEAMKNIVKSGKVLPENSYKIEAKIKESFPEAMVEDYIHLEKIMENDPKDRHVLAAAVKVKDFGSDVRIVTDNISDFPDAALAPWNITAQSIDEFLSDLFDDSPDTIIRVLKELSHKYKKPPKTFEELVDFLGKKAGIPNFVSRVLLYEYGLDIVERAKTLLQCWGKPIPEGGEFYDCSLYSLSQKGQILTIMAKDGRGTIILFQDNQLEGKIAIEDVNFFKDSSNIL